MDKSAWIFAITLLLLVLAAVASYFSSKKDNKLVNKLTTPLILCVLILSGVNAVLDWSQKAADKIDQKEKDIQQAAADKQRDQTREAQNLAEQRRDREKKTQDSIAQGRAQHSLDSLGYRLDWMTGKLSEKPTVASRVEREIRTVYLPSTSVSRENARAGAVVVPTSKGTTLSVDTDLITAFKEDGLETDMADYEIRDKSNLKLCFGEYQFINKFNESLILYSIYSRGHHYEPDMLISANGRSTTPQIQAGYYSFNSTNCESSGSSYQFYFETEDKRKFGVLTLVPHVGKIKNKVLAPSSLHLATNGKRIKID